MKRIAIVCVTICFLFATACQAQDERQISIIIESFLGNISSDQKLIRPNYGGQSVKVEVSIYPLGIGSISEQNGDFKIDLYLRQKWNDPRLRFNGVKELSFRSDTAKNIWLPDTFITNSKRFHLDSLVSSANQQSSFLRIRDNGDVFYSNKISVVASCSFNLKYFPHDEQVCTLEFESYGYNEKEIKYIWQDSSEAFLAAPHIKTSSLKFMGFQLREKYEALSTGNYSRLIADFYFTRTSCSYYFKIYFPAALILVLSWVPFWLDFEQQRLTRIMLSLVSTLAITIFSSSWLIFLEWSKPSASTKFIEIYLFVCMALVYGTLIPIAHFLMMAIRRPKCQYQKQNNSTIDTPQCPHRKSRGCPCVKFGYPLLFFVFNIVYAFYVSYN